MQHRIPVTELEAAVGPQIHGMARAVEACVHCGFCLAVCPTYKVLGEEMDSPRGRILLMKTALEGELPVEETLPYVDRCLGCLACVTACPSGVQYEELVVPYRAYTESRRSRSMAEKAQRGLLNATLPHPGRFRLAASAGRLARPIQPVLPEEIRNMLAMLPGRLPRAEPLPACVPAIGPRRGRVALLAGCVQQALAPEINWATLRVLAQNGVEVVIPAQQGCCGAMQIHDGEHTLARQMARRNLSAFAGVLAEGVDAILTNAAGCGSGMKSYPLLFEGLEEADQVREFSGLVQDACAYLEGLGLLEPPPLPHPLRIAYHDACHLAHAQGVRDAPRNLLRLIPNLELVEIAEGDTCCGSAGTYNIEQPEIAAALGKRKAENILAAGAEAVAMGNIGCMVQVRSHLAELGKDLPVYHTIEVLDLAYHPNGRY